MVIFVYLIPVVVAGIFHILFRSKISKVETILMFAIPTLFLGATQVVMYYSDVTDSYHTQHLVDKVSYYEPYETYIHKTCQTCTSNSKGGSTCRSYDCSYCDYNEEYFELTSTDGDKWKISKKEYDSIVSEFKPNNPYFSDLNRNITKTFSCGFDGDKWTTNWNNQILHSITKSNTHAYINPVLANRNAYNIKDYTENEISSKGLYKRLDNLEQNVFGINNTGLSTEQNYELLRYVDYYNSIIRSKNGGNVIYIFTNKAINYAKTQSDIWVKGKKNQLVVIIGLKPKTTLIDWVYPFSWNEKMILHVDVRNDIMNLKTMNNYEKIIVSTKTNMEKSFKVRNMDDFNYLSHNIGNTQLIILTLLSCVISIGFCYYCANNEYDYDGGKTNNDKWLNKLKNNISVFEIYNKWRS